MTALPVPNPENLSATADLAAHRGAELGRPLLHLVGAGVEAAPRPDVASKVAAERARLEAVQAAILRGGPAVAAAYRDEQNTIRFSLSTAPLQPAFQQPAR